MTYTKFQVGEKFPLPIAAQGDGGIFQYDKNGAMFILKLSRVDMIAVEAFRTGKIELALFVRDDILFLLYKIDGIINGWGDCPHSCQILATQQRPDFSKSQENVLHLYLVDSRLDALLALRTVDLSAAFHHRLLQTIQAQLAQSFCRETYAARVQALWRLYTPEEMRQQALATEEIQFTIAAAPNDLQ